MSLPDCVCVKNIINEGDIVFISICIFNKTLLTFNNRFIFYYCTSNFYFPLNLKHDTKTHLRHSLFCQITLDKASCSAMLFICVRVHLARNPDTHRVHCTHTRARAQEKQYFGAFRIFLHCNNIWRWQINTDIKNRGRVSHQLLWHKKNKII